MLTFRLIFANTFSVEKQRGNGAVLIAATIVAAIKLRGEGIDNSPRTHSAISEAIQLARMVLSRLESGW